MWRDKPTENVWKSVSYEACEVSYELCLDVGVWVYAVRQEFLLVFLAFTNLVVIWIPHLNQMTLIVLSFLCACMEWAGSPSRLPSGRCDSPLDFWLEHYLHSLQLKVSAFLNSYFSLISVTLCRIAVAEWRDEFSRLSFHIKATTGENEYTQKKKIRNFK